jgi:hypothetical protein
MMTHNLQEKIVDIKLREILMAHGQNDLHSKDKTRPHENEQGKSWQTNKITYRLGTEQNHKGQQEDVQPRNQITYILRTEQGHERVRRWICSKQTRSHTV